MEKPFLDSQTSFNAMNKDRFRGDGKIDLDNVGGCPKNRGEPARDGRGRVQMGSVGKNDSNRLGLRRNGGTTRTRRPFGIGPLINRLRPMIRIAVLIAVVVFADFPVQADTSRRFTNTEWTEDIDAFVEHLREIYINPFHAIPEEDFLLEVNALKSNVPELTDFDIGLGISHLASLIRDGHTWIRFGVSFAPGRLPIRLDDFANGIFVVAGLGDAKHLSAVQLISIGGVATEDVLQRTTPFVSGDNAWGRRLHSLSLLNDEAFLRREDLVAPDSMVRLELSSKGKERTILALDFISKEAYALWTDDPSNFVDEATPMYRSRINETYWMQYLPEENAVYAQFNEVANKEGGPHFVGFGREMLVLVEETGAKKLIVDLRHNGGGSGNLLDPTIRRIAENKRINRKGRLFVLTSPKTFSAALMFTVRMERNTNALFAGVPGGGKPNSYSEFNAITLPNSGMTGSISSLWHQEGTPDDTRDYVPVDIPAQLTSDDYFADRDPVLDAVLAH